MLIQVWHYFMATLASSGPIYDCAYMKVGLGLKIFRANTLNFPCLEVRSYVEDSRNNFASHMIQCDVK